MNAMWLLGSKASGGFLIGLSWPEVSLLKKIALWMLMGD